MNGSLNREASASHNVTIRVNDGVNTYDQIFSITVNDVNEAPTDIALSANTVNENAAIGTVIGTLSSTDVDLPGDTFTYSIVSDPDNKFTIVGNQLRLNNTVDFETQTTHSVTVRTNDGNGGTYDEVFTINVTDINDAPVLTAGTASLAQGNVYTFDTSVLTATDTDDVDAGLVYEITSNVTDGQLRLNGVAIGLGDTFTQQDIIDGNVTYAHDNTATVTNDSFNVTVSDGSITTAAQTVNLNIDVSLNVISTVITSEGDDSIIFNTNLDYTQPAGGWYDANWQYRREVTVNAAHVDSDLTDYPLLITEVGMDADFWANVQNDGDDIVITDAAGNKLDRELVSINTIGQTLQLYVRADLSSTIDTTLYLYYGNLAANETNDTTTWRNEFTGVWHFDDDFSDGDVADSSQQNNDAFNRGGFGAGNQVTGITGNAGQFNNVEYLALNYAYSGNNSLPVISVSAWVNTTENSGGQNNNWSVIDFDRSDFFNVYTHGDGRVSFSTNANGDAIDDQYANGTSLNDGNWHHIAAVYDGTDKILYANGVEVDRVTNPHNGLDLGINSTRYGFIGDGSEASSFDAGRNNLYYDGLFDNIRLYEGVMDDAWVAAEYRNHNDAASFYSVGGQDVPPNNIAFTITDNVDNGTLYIDSNTNGILDGGEAIGLGDTFTQNQIDTNILRYVHNGGETTSDSFSFTANNGIITTAQNTLNISVTPVNDAPTNIALTNSNILEIEIVGTVIGSLSTSDVDLPGDTFTYSIQSDPDGKFAIVGNELRLASTLNAGLQDSHSVTIRTVDGNGGTFDQIFTISVTRVSIFTELPENPNIIGEKQANTKPQKEIQTNQIIRNFVTDVNVAANNGNNEINQPIHDNVVENNNSLRADLPVNRQNLPNNFAFETPFSLGEIEAGNNTEESTYTRMIDFLQKTQEFSGEDDYQSHDSNLNGDEDSASITTLQRNFDDILVYHERRAADLKNALMGESERRSF